MFVKKINKKKTQERCRNSQSNEIFSNDPPFYYNWLCAAVFYSTPSLDLVKMQVHWRKTFEFYFFLYTLICLIVTNRNNFRLSQTPKRHNSSSSRLTGLEMDFVMQSLLRPVKFLWYFCQYLPGERGNNACNCYGLSNERSHLQIIFIDISKVFTLSRPLMDKAASGWFMPGLSKEEHGSSFELLWSSFQLLIQSFSINSKVNKLQR